MPVLQPCSKALKLGVGLFVLSLFVWQLLESRHEQAVTKLNKTSLEALLQHLKSEELVRRQLASGGPHADRAGGRNQQPNHAAFHFVSSGLVRHMAAAQARMHLERAMKLAAAEKRLRLALEVSDTITSSGRAAGLGSAERGGMEAAVEAAGAAAEALAALKAAHTAAEPPVTFGVQLSCGSANPCGLWQVHGPQAATAPATAASASMLATRAPLPADAETGREPQSRTVSTPEAGCPAGGAAGSGDAAEGHGSEGDPAAMAAVAGAARTPDGGADVSDAGMEGVRKPPQCPAAAAVVAAAHHGDRPEAGALAAAACGDTAAATSAGVAQAEQGEAAAEPAAPLPATLYRRVVGGAAWLTSRLPPLLPLTAGGRFDLWYSSQVQLLALMPRYYLLLSPALAASGVPLPLLDWARRHRLPHFTPLPPTAHQQPHQQQEPGPGLAPAAGEPVLGMSYSGSSSRAGSATHGDSEEVRQRELLLPQLPAGAGDALAECRLEESSSLWVLSASAANGGASVARVPQPHSPVCSGTQGGSCCAGSSGAASGAALTPLVLPLPRLPRRARRVVCNVTVPEGTAATLSGLPVQGPSACQWNATQRQGHVFSFVVFEELDTFSRSLMSADGVIAAATGSSSGSGSGSAGWLRSTAYGSGHGAGGRGDSSRRAAYAAAAGVFGRSAGTMSGWMRGGFHIGGGVLAGAWLPATAAAPAATADAGAHDSGGPTGRADAERYWQQERDQARRADQQHQPPPQPPPSVAGFVARGLAALRAVLSGLDGSTLYYCSSYLCDSTLYKPRKIASDVSDGRGEGIGRASVFWAVQGGLLALLLPLLRMVDSLLGLDWRALGSMAVAGWRLAAALGGPLLLPHLAVLRLLLPHTELWQVDVMMVTAAGLICSYAECLLATRLLLRWRADVEDAAGVRLDTPTANIIWRRVCQEASGPRLFCWRRMLAWRGPLDGALVCAAVYQYSCSRAGAGLDPVLRLLLPLLCRWEQAKSLMAQAMYSRLSAVEVATRASKQFIQVASTARLLHDSVEPLTLTQMAAVLEPHNRELWRLLAADDGREAALPLTAAQHVLMAMQRHRNGGRDRPQGQGQRELQLRERDRERERLRRRQEAAAGSEEGGSGATQPAADVKWPPPIKVPDGPGVTAGAGSGGGDVIAPRAFLCPITHDVMTQPCLLISPQLLSAPTYERSAIQTWLTLRQTDPRTNTTLITWILLPNDELFRCIDDWARGLEVVAVEATEAAAAPIDAAAEQCAQYGSSPTDG